MSESESEECSSREQTIHLWGRMELEECRDGNLPESEELLSASEIKELAEKVILPQQDASSDQTIYSVIASIRPDLSEDIANYNDIENVIIHLTYTIFFICDFFCSCCFESFTFLLLLCFLNIAN